MRILWKIEISEMWLLWKMRFQKCEFSEKWDFRNVNFVKIEISEMWILWKMRFLEMWILGKMRFQKLGFSICEFLDKMWIFAPAWRVIWNFLVLSASSHTQKQIASFSTRSSHTRRFRDFSRHGKVRKQRSWNCSLFDNFLNHSLIFIVRRLSKILQF